MIHKLSPALRISLSFLFVIVTGALLLKLPFALENGTSLSWLDSFFMSTSATCVTGLSPLDVNSTFTVFGELVLLLLMQVGGIGVMVLSSYFFLSLGRNMSVRQRLLIQESFAGDYDVNWKTLVRTVIHYVAVIEIVGAILLSFLFSSRYPFLDAVYKGIFHSVSAFCNGGLSLFSDNLVSYRDNVPVNIVVTALIILGGIGFFVMWELRQWFQLRKVRYRLSLHTKTVIVASLSLVVLGTFVLWLFELNNPAFGGTALSRLVPAFFQSVTCRTAGLNTVDLSSMGNDSIMLLMCLMFIGASPGSCGGGVKTTTIAVIFVMFWSRLKGAANINLFKRTLSPDLVGRSFGVAVAAAFILLLSNVLLMMTDFSDGHFARSRFIEFFFESISALGTVGLSLGVTPHLNAVGKTIVIVLMFFGRIGVMAMFLQAVSARTRQSVEYAEEGLMIG